MDDLISRQAAIDAVEKESQVDGAYGYMDTKSIIDLLCDLPSAQPEIIRCKECKRQDTDNVFLSMWCYEMRTFVKPNDFCSRAERRIDG